MRWIRRRLHDLISVGSLLSGVRNWPALLALWHRPRPRQLVALQLRDGTSYAVGSLAEAWDIKRTSLDLAYERYGVPIQDGWNVVDIGAGLGDFAIFAARRTPHGRVYAYESTPHTAELLRHNLQRNNICNVTLFPYAVTRERDTDTTANGAAVAAARHPARRQTNGPGSVERLTAVRSITLAGVLADLPGGVCDFLKMAGREAEYCILLTAGESTLSRIQRLCVEYHDGHQNDSHDDLARFLEAHGWLIRLYPSPVRSGDGFLYAENPVTQ